MGQSKTCTVELQDEVVKTVQDMPWGYEVTTKIEAHNGCIKI